jgi:hypothetical protein
MKTTQAPDHPAEYHQDPLTGEPGCHPVGTGVGAAAGGVALGVVGAVAGPVGAAVGVAVGAILGGLTGKGFAEGFDPTAEEAFWREHHRHQPYAKEGHEYDAYARAYRTGYEGYQPGQTFAEREAELRAKYESHYEDDAAIQDNLRTHPLREQTAFGEPSATMEDNMRTRPLPWTDARVASQAAYERVREAQEARDARAQEAQTKTEPPETR